MLLVLPFTLVLLPVAKQDLLKAFSLLTSTLGSVLTSTVLFTIPPLQVFYLHVAYVASQLVLDLFGMCLMVFSKFVKSIRLFSPVF